MEERIKDDTEFLELGEQAKGNSVRRNGWNSFRRYVGWEKL